MIVPGRFLFRYQVDQTAAPRADSLCVSVPIRFPVYDRTGYGINFKLILHPAASHLTFVQHTPVVYLQLEVSVNSCGTGSLFHDLLCLGLTDVIAVRGGDGVPLNIIVKAQDFPRSRVDLVVVLLIFREELYIIDP